MNRTNQKIDENIASNIDENYIKAQLEGTENVSNVNFSALKDYAYMGEKPRYHYKKSLSRKLMQKNSLNVEMKAPFNEAQGNYQLMQTQNLMQIQNYPVFDQNLK